MGFKDSISMIIHIFLKFRGYFFFLIIHSYFLYETILYTTNLLHRNLYYTLNIRILQTLRIYIIHSYILRTLITYIIHSYILQTLKTYIIHSYILQTLRT